MGESGISRGAVKYGTLKNAYSDPAQLREELVKAERALKDRVADRNGARSRLLDLQRQSDVDGSREAKAQLAEAEKQIAIEDKIIEYLKAELKKEKR